jgi:hypothetical protein
VLVPLLQSSDKQCFLTADVQWLIQHLKIRARHVVRITLVVFPQLLLFVNRVEQHEVVQLFHGLGSLFVQHHCFEVCRGVTLCCVSAGNAFLTGATELAEVPTATTVFSTLPSFASSGWSCLIIDEAEHALKKKETMLCCFFVCNLHRLRGPGEAFHRPALGQQHLMAWLIIDEAEHALKTTIFCCCVSMFKAFW